MDSWQVALSKKAAKQTKALPKTVQENLYALIRQIEIYGPVRGDWPNYGKLSPERHHCHIKKGRPTYVAVWEVSNRTIRLIELYMLERTKKPRTDKTVVLTFQGPESNRQAAVESLSNLGFVDTSDSIPWREAFPEVSDEKGPGVVLRAMRRREGLTQKELSKVAGIPQGHISAMEGGKIKIGVARAKKLGKALNAGYRVFL